MDFTSVQTLETNPGEALRRLKLVLQREGFAETTEVDFAGLLRTAKAGEVEFCTLVNAYDPKLVQSTLEVAREAALLPATSFLVREYNGGSLVEALDPRLLAVAAARPELQPVAEEARARVDGILGQLANEPDAPTPETGTLDVPEPEAGDLSGQVEDRLFKLILEAAEAVSGGEALRDSGRIFELAKAYTAIASLKRAEEVELHLA